MDLNTPATPSASTRPSPSHRLNSPTESVPFSFSASSASSSASSASSPRSPSSEEETVLQPSNKKVKSSLNRAKENRFAQLPLALRITPDLKLSTIGFDSNTKGIIRLG